MKNIFVGNLSFNTSEDDLRRLFETYGQVDRVSILTDRETGRSRGFGFVEMTNAEEHGNSFFSDSRGPFGSNRPALMLDCPRAKVNPQG